MKPETLCVGCMEHDSGLPVCPGCGRPFDLAAKNAMQLKPRTILHEQYLIGRALGDGGFGITYLAWDLGLEQRLAIKEYMPSGVAGRSNGETKVLAYSEQGKQEFEWGLERFLEEARVLKKFSSHPGIVSVDTVFRENGTAYLVMEFLNGVTFEEFLVRRGGRIAFETAMRVVLPSMEALSSVHREGILHRDISPDNIYLTRDGKVKLIDFGAARNALSQKSRNLSIILKEGYAPEEQYRASGIQGPWTDVYAMAATLYHSVTGKLPQPALDRQAQDNLQWPSQLGIQMEPRAEAALMKALSIKANDRFQSMEDFKAALGGSLDFVPVTRPLSASDPKPVVTPIAVPIPVPVSAQPVSYAQPQVPAVLPIPMPVQQIQSGGPQTRSAAASGGSSQSRWLWLMIPAAAALVCGAVLLTVLLPKYFPKPVASTVSSAVSSVTSTVSSTAGDGGGGTTSTASSTDSTTGGSGGGGTDAAKDDGAKTAGSGSGGSGASSTASDGGASDGTDAGASGAAASGGDAGGSVAAVAGGPQYDGFAREASDHMNNNEWDQAADVLTQAIPLRPANPKAYALLGEVYLYGLGNLAEAMKNYRAAVARGGEVVFHVNHDHGGGNFSAVCEGRLHISKSSISFSGIDSVHKFHARRGEIKEAKKNKVMGLFARGQVDLSAFHIKLADGHNYNLSPLSNFTSAERDLILSLVGK